MTATLPAPQRAMVTEPVLQLLDVTRIHGSGETAVHALRGISLEIGAGELIAVMGPSGSGKSTLLNIAGALDAPTTGAVEICGVMLEKLSATELAKLRRTRVGVVFQDYNLIPSLTAAENIGLPLELDGMNATLARQEARAALRELGLIGLSDEPTGALDSVTGEEVLALLRARCDAGAAGLLVTHEPRHAAWADRVVYLRDGVIVDAHSVADAGPGVLR